MSFELAYIEAALWSSTDDIGTPLDSNYDLRDIAPDTLGRMKSDCAAFQETEGLSEMGSDDQNGHDFWLTRNGHGAGFWDRGYENKSAVDAICKVCKGYGSFDLYIGDDGMIHGQ